MRVGWLADQHDPPGGAELTQAEFRAAAPESVQVVTVEPGAEAAGFGADVYVVHNCQTYTVDELPRGSSGDKIIRYFHDVRGYQGLLSVPVYCSPLQREFMGGQDGCLTIPPPVDLAAFRPTSTTQRKGTCSIGAWMNPGKGGHLVSEWADRNEPVDVYGWGPFVPQGPNVNLRGPLDASKVAETLWQYERFIFLPTALEPFGRCVVEAWAGGCELVVNGNVGARYWIEEAPEKLETAAADFWAVVLP